MNFRPLPSHACHPRERGGLRIESKQGPRFHGNDKFLVGIFAVTFVVFGLITALPIRAADAPTQAAVAGTVETPAAGPPLTLQRFLSPQVQACMKTGNCTLDDIVSTGAAFANLLTELSAAVFFATFVYGGGMYLLSFGDSHRVDTGKSAMTGAAIGMAIVLGAWTLVQTLVKIILTGSAT